MRNKAVWTILVLSWLALIATIPATIHDWSKTGPNVFWGYALGIALLGALTFLAWAAYRKPRIVR